MPDNAVGAIDAGGWKKAQVHDYPPHGDWRGRSAQKRISRCRLHGEVTRLTLRGRRGLAVIASRAEALTRFMEAYS